MRKTATLSLLRTKLNNNNLRVSVCLFPLGLRAEVIRGLSQKVFDFFLRVLLCVSYVVVGLP